LRLLINDCNNQNSRSTLIRNTKAFIRHAITANLPPVSDANGTLLYRLLRSAMGFYDMPQGRSADFDCHQHLNSIEERHSHEPCWNLDTGRNSKAIAAAFRS